MTIRTNPCSSLRGQVDTLLFSEIVQQYLLCCVGCWQNKLTGVANFSVKVLDDLLVAGSFPPPGKYYLSLIHHHPSALSIKSTQVAKYDIKMNDIITSLVWRDCISYMRKQECIYLQTVYFLSKFPFSKWVVQSLYFLLWSYIYSSWSEYLSNHWNLALYVMAKKILVCEPIVLLLLQKLSYIWNWRVSKAISKTSATTLSRALQLSVIHKNKAYKLKLIFYKTFIKININIWKHLLGGLGILFLLFLNESSFEELGPIKSGNIQNQSDVRMYTIGRGHNNLGPTSAFSCAA